MRYTVLGSGTLVPDDHRRSAAHHLKGPDFSLMMDCGPGSVHGFTRQGLDWAGVSHLAITHFHTDHVGDVPGFLWALTHGMPDERTEPLVILGPPGIEAFIQGLARLFGPHVLDPGFPVRVVELQRSDAWPDPEERFLLRTHPTVHTEHSLAYRIETPAGSVGYTGDTGPDDGLFHFLAGLDLVVAECSNPDPPAMDTHLTPAGLARLGRLAAPAKLVATHVYAPLEPNDIPARVREAGWSGPVVAGVDGLEILVGGSGPDA